VRLPWCAVTGRRGYSVLLVEQDDFAKGTFEPQHKASAWSVRYLKQGIFPLCSKRSANADCSAKTAPHLVHHLSFIVPIYSWWEGPFYGIGMKIYDRLAGKLGLEPSKISRVRNAPANTTLEPLACKRG